MSTTEHQTEAACGGSALTAVFGTGDSMREIHWAFTSKAGEVIPSTIRRKRGDAEAALKKVKYNHDPEDCELVRVKVEICPYDVIDGEVPNA
jgi:hypothetical protein